MACARRASPRVDVIICLTGRCSGLTEFPNGLSGIAASGVKAAPQQPDKIVEANTTFGDKFGQLPLTLIIDLSEHLFGFLEPA